MLFLKLASRSTRSLLKSPLPYKDFIGTQRIQPLVSTPDKTNRDISKSWTPIYKFEHIKFFLALNNLKKYQMLGTAILVPASVVMDIATENSLELPILTSAIGFSGILALVVASYALKGSVGFVYTNTQDPDVVKLSYMNFWGVRTDVEMMIDEVVPLSEIPTTFLNRYFTTLRFHGDPLKLKLFYKIGNIIDQIEFERVFGSIS